MPKIHIPETGELGTQIGSLVGKTIKVSKSDGPNSFDESCHTARYLTRDDKLAALCQFDLPVAAYLGAALAMIPAGVAQEAAKEGDLGDNLTDAFSEVANIMAGLLCIDGAPHVRWVSIQKTLGDLEDDSKATVENPCRRIDIDIDGYGAGKLTILTTEIG